jgi:RNA polymerase sigma-70 factor, ECF subfamily
VALIDRLLGRPTPEEVVREHRAMVARLLHRIFGPRADIDDVFQAVFVEVLRSLPNWAGRAQLKTWIHRITLNVAYQEMRLRYREQRLRVKVEDVETFAHDRQSAEDDAIQSEAARQLYTALESVDPKKRIAVILHDLEGHTLKEVSEILGRPLQTVASQVKFGRAELAARFREQGMSKPELFEVRSS